MKTLKPFTKEQRVKIYRKALNIFKGSYKSESYVGGMCEVIGSAILDLEYGFNGPNRKHPSCCDGKQLKKFWPEFAKHKPKTCWSVDRRFWFSRYSGENGYEKRVKILEEISEHKKSK
jgi:hypothetical protein